MFNTVNLVTELRRIHNALLNHSTQDVAMLRLNALITDLETTPQKWIVEMVQRDRMTGRAGQSLMPR